MKDISKRQISWSSRFAFLMAAVGSAVGLGNIWRFPYLAGENGGGTFIIIYLISLLVIATPLLGAEILIGRMAKREPISATRYLSDKFKQSRLWVFVGGIAIVAAVVLLSYYCIIGGWTLKYFIASLASVFPYIGPTESSAYFSGFVGNAGSVVGWGAFFLILNLLMSFRGLKKGVERVVLVMMPLLFIILMGLLFYVMSLPGFVKALHFMFHISKVNHIHGMILAAVGHSFFTLSIGMGAMMTYGSYLNDKEPLMRSSILIAAADTFVAIVAGIIVFTVVFSFNLQPGAGPGLTFVTLPVAFGKMHGGVYIAAAFFLLLALAALTSSLSLLEAVVAWAQRRFSLSRGMTVLSVSAVTFLLGLISAFSFNILSDFHPLTFIGFKTNTMTLFDVIDFIVSNVVLIVSGISIALFVGYALPKDEVKNYMFGHKTIKNAPYFKPWYFALRIVAPLALIYVLISGLV